MCVCVCVCRRGWPAGGGSGYYLSSGVFLLPLPPARYVNVYMRNRSMSAYFLRLRSWTLVGVQSVVLYVVHSHPVSSPRWRRCVCCVCVKWKKAFVSVIAIVPSVLDASLCIACIPPCGVVSLKYTGDLNRSIDHLVYVLYMLYIWHTVLVFCKRRYCCV